MNLPNNPAPPVKGRIANLILDDLRHTTYGRLIATDEQLLPRPPSTLVRETSNNDRKIKFVDALIQVTAEMVEVIWPLETTEFPVSGKILPLDTFIRETLRRSRTSYSTLQVTLYYLIQIKDQVPDPETILQDEKPDGEIRILGSGKRVFLAALMVASKYLQDRNWSGRAWSKITGLPLIEINEIERAFLQTVNWNLFVPSALWEKWTNLVLEKAVPAMNSKNPFEDPAFSEWKLAVWSLTPDLRSVDVYETHRGEDQSKWTPQPHDTFHSELERRRLLFKPLLGSAGSVQSGLSELATQVSGLTLESVATSATYQTARTNYTTTSIATYFTAPMAHTTLSVIHEEQKSTSAGDEAQRIVTSAYLKALQAKNLIPSFDTELNWSGTGQHVEFPPGAPVPLEHIDNLGSSASAIVDRVRCKRILLARKTMRCPRKWAQADALNEVEHLQSLRHAHIVQLVGTYVQNRTFAVLMYPAADCDLCKFMEDTNDMRTSAPEASPSTLPGTESQYNARLSTLASFLGCLASALAFIHSRTTKHADIKPANVLVKRRANDASAGSQPFWRVYIADFGLSRKFLSENSQTDGPTARTPRYCAPEVYLYEARGRSSDVFSLGCVFTEMLTVYAGFDLDDLREHLCDDGGPDHYHTRIDATRGWIQSKISDQIPLALSECLQAMLEESPKERPTAASLKAFFQLPLLSPPFRAMEELCCDVGSEPYVAE